VSDGSLQITYGTCTAKAAKGMAKTSLQNRWIGGAVSETRYTSAKRDHDHAVLQAKPKQMPSQLVA